LVREKSTFFLKKIGEKAAKIVKKTPQSPRPRDKEPDSVFFCHSVLFFCGAVREEVCGGYQAVLRCAKAGYWIHPQTLKIFVVEQGSNFNRLDL
jgi:hypothetical protein